MFEKDVMWSAGLLCAASLRGRRLRWFAVGSETQRWAFEIELPRGFSPGDVAALDASAQGVTVIAKDGRLAFLNVQRHRWELISNALTDPAVAP